MWNFLHKSWEVDQFMEFPCQKRDIKLSEIVHNSSAVTINVLNIYSKNEKMLNLENELMSIFPQMPMYVTVNNAIIYY